MKEQLKKLNLWFSQRPQWLQYAIEQILSKDCITEENIADFTEKCKKEALGELTKKKYRLPNQLFENFESKKLKVKSLSDIHGVNALAPNTVLDFGQSNFSIVYGPNGSGKSGHTRIIKHACGAPYPGTLHRNVYESNDSTQKALFAYYLNNDSKEKKGAWKASDGVLEDLQGIDVFDSSSGRLYITQEHELNYEPLILSFFSDLVSVCDKVAACLCSEIENLSNKLPTLPVEYLETSWGKKYGEISLENKNDFLSLIWTDENEFRLNVLQKKILEPSPEKKIEELKCKKTHLNTLEKEINTFLCVLSKDKYKEFLDLKKAYVKKREAAEVAVSLESGNIIFEGIGSEIWKQLWEFARKYSNEYAYKQSSFPVITENSRCVLCHQLLTDESKERFKLFDDYVKGEAQNAATEAKQKWEEAKKRIEELPSIADLSVKMDAAGIPLELKNRLQKLCEIFQKRKDLFLEKISVAFPEFLEFEDVEWKKLESDYQQEIDGYQQSSSSEDRKKLSSEFNELKCKRWIIEQQAAVKKELERLASIEALKKARKLANTQALSSKKSDLAEKLITEDFINRFNQELEVLGASHLKVELVKSRGVKGRIFHRIRLVEASVTSVEDVLSEGEQRIVALAAFLANITGEKKETTCVFDDPTSSLDQDFEKAVVKRLVDLLDQRQVIIFTHRLAFVALAEYYAKDLKPKILKICSFQGKSGQPTDLPTSQSGIKKALNKLINERLNKAKNYFFPEKMSDYELYARGICTDFRIIIERTIEIDLLCDVVQRYRPQVHTLKISKLSKITEEDCDFLDNLMSKYSEQKHSQPDEAPLPLSKPEDLEKDLISLRDWREEFQKRGVCEETS